MKKFLLLIILFSSMLSADGTELTLKSYSTDTHIDTRDIANHASEFTIEKQEDRDDNFVIILIDSEDESSMKQNNSHTFRWIMIELEDNLTSGTYWIRYAHFDFTDHTFTLSQSGANLKTLKPKLIHF
ncbi:MAG: hypothetical protein Q9M39_06335 [Sulfurovum sp.]|nr:hypothetical protein [Sulfurovum sp.]